MSGPMRRVRGIELVRVGAWHTSTGPWTVTADTLRAALNAHRAGIIRRPVVKLGHVDTRFDGQPAFGHVADMRITPDGQTLVGDLVVPAWLADALPVNFPDRSVEASLDWVDGTGKVWPVVIEAVALLGAEAPAISSLKSLQDLVAASANRRRVDIRSSPAQPASQTVRVAAARRQRRHNRKGRP